MCFNIEMKMGSMSTEVQGHLDTGLWDVTSAKPLAKMVAFCGSSHPQHCEQEHHREECQKINY